jgi:hypothetical protein
MAPANGWPLYTGLPMLTACVAPASVKTTV